MNFNKRIFREYDIRGIADSDLADPVIYPLSKAIASYFLLHQCKKVSLGHDCRLSSPRIMEAIKKGFLGCGLEVFDIGMVPTPVLYFSVFKLRLDGGIMITGSHNPAEHNGLKILLGDSTIHGTQIQAILSLLEKNSFPSGAGQLHKQEILDQYVKHILSSIPPCPGINVVIDSGNGVAGLVAGNLYSSLGCNVTELFSEPDGRFPNHHPDPTVFENLSYLVTSVKNSGAHIGIGFDGDGDRIGVIDNSGNMVFGDELLVLYSRQVLSLHPGATIISEVKASNRLFQDIEKHGGKPIQWKTGHSLIKAKMKETNALLAGEMSGHMFFRDRYFGFDDAIYAGARLIEILYKTHRSLIDLLSDLPPSFSTPEIRMDCPDDIKFAVVEKVHSSLVKRGHKINSIDGVRIEFEDGWGLVRPSNTQPVLVFRFEAFTKNRLQEIRNLVESTVSEVLSTIH